MIGFFIMKNQIVIVIKQDDTLVNIFKNTGFQAIEHAVGRVVETAPVQQKSGKAVTADGIVQKIIHIGSRPEQKYGIDRNNGKYSVDHTAILEPVFPGDGKQFSDQQDKDQCYKGIAEDEMHPVKRPHLVAVSGDNGISWNISDGNLRDGIDGKNDNLKDSVRKTDTGNNFQVLCKIIFGEINGKYKKTYQHDIYAGKIDTGHNRHAKITVVENTDQITDVYHSGNCTGKAQVSAGGFIFLDGYNGQQDICQSNQNGNNNISL